MNRFSALQQVREHQAIVTKYELALQKSPEDRKLHIGLKGAAKRLERSQALLYHSASEKQLDIVNYRIVRYREDYPALSVSESITAFQNAFIAVSDAVINGPKDRASYNRDAVEQASLGFGYTYPGSLGVVLLAPNDRSLFNEGKLDESVNALRDFLNVQNADDAKDASRQMGLAAVSKIYDWVKINSTWENSVDYKWRRSDDVWSGEYVDQERFHDLKVLLENAAEPTFFDSEISGYLVGFDVKRRRFHLVTLADDDISGKIDESFVEPSAVVSADSRYRAYIRETTTRFAATGKTETKYTLLKLQPDG